MNTQNRRSFNLQINNLLREIIEAYPDLRFGQIIEVFCKDQNTDFFNEAPDVILQRMKDKMKEYYGC
jgi:hypothetical protein